jgi:hypothetical protein
MSNLYICKISTPITTGRNGNICTSIGGSSSIVSSSSSAGEGVSLTYCNGITKYNNTVTLGGCLSSDRYIISDTDSFSSNVLKLC